MYKYFLQTYQDKTEEELMGIVASRKVQHKDAVKAASQLLHTEFGHDETISRNKKVRYSSTSKFFKTFSFREIYSLITSALLFVAINMLFIDHGLVDYFEQTYSFVICTMYLSSILLCHYWYRKEHKRRNRFWPRVINTTILTALIVILLTLKNAYISDFENSFFDIHPAAMPFSFFFLALLFESVISSVIHFKEMIWRI